MLNLARKAQTLLLLLFFCFSMLGALPTNAQDLRFEPLGEHQGLEAQVGVALLVDRTGFLWVGSRQGLFRYDGYRAVKFEPGSDQGTITDSDIRALYEDSQGILWVATNTGGLNRFDPATGRFTAYRHDSTDPGSLSDDSVYGMAEGPDDDLWVGSQIGLNRLDRQTGRFTRFFHNGDDPTSLPNDYVFTVFKDRENSLWIATVGGGLSRWNPASESFTHLDLVALTDHSNGELNDVFALAEDFAGNLWIGTRRGLLKLDRGRVEPQLFDLTGEGPATRQPLITALRMGVGHKLWIATLGHGLFELFPESGRLTRYRDELESGDSGLTQRPLLDVRQYRDTVFLSTWGNGVKVARLPQIQLGLLGGEDGLRNSTVSAILADEKGQPWIGSFGGGPQRVHIETKTAHLLPGEQDDLWREGVQSLVRSHERKSDGSAEGLIYAGTTNGLWELESDGTARSFFQYDAEAENGIGEGYISQLLMRNDGRIWVGVGGSGLHLFSPQNKHFQAFRHDPADPFSLSGDYITCVLDENISPSSEDSLWVGTRSNGLNLCTLDSSSGNPGTDTLSCRPFTADTSGPLQLGHHHVTTVFRDRRQRVWVGTDGGGLHEVLREADGSVAGFKRYSKDDGLLSDGIMAIQEDADGSLWLSTRLGLSRFDPDLGRVVSYVEAGGLPTITFTARAAARDDQYLYFGSADGLIYIPLGLPFRARDPSSIRITSAEKIGVQSGPPATRRVPESFTIRDGDVLSLEFAVLDYAETPHEYAFRLKSDGDWTQMGPRRSVTFVDLQPGEYRFEARGRDIFGLWQNTEPVDIVVVPPWWATTGFRLLLGVLAVLLAVGVHLVRTTTLRRHAEEIRRLSERREKALEEALGDEAELAGLTPRQKEVLQLIAEGRSTRQIAERLGVSIKTVETHRSNLMDRLDIRDVPGLVRLAIRTRLVSPHD